MPRIRWYHFYFLLAVFNVVVIAFTLRLHQQTVGWVEDLMAEEHQLDARMKWLQQTQKCISELNAPGNNLFHARGPADYRRQRLLFDRATKNVSASMASASGFDVDVSRIASEVDLMRADAEEVFEVFQPVERASVSDAVHGDMIHDAGPAMARMDAHLHRALALLGTVSNQFAQSRIDLIERYEADIHHQFVSQRFIIAAILLILVGAFLFGRRLHAADRALETERRRVREMQRERLASVGELCSSVAHGIRNPLASIRSSAELALELGQIDGDSRERIRDILDEGRRLGDRVTGLLSMARANSDSFAEVDLAQVIDVSAKGLLPEIERRGLALELEGIDDPIIVRGDRARLEQCVVELLSNAMEHSPDGGSILIRCQASADDAVIAIEDEGPGIPTPIRERVFDLFFSTRPTGTGIGLATVKRIARLHGGDAMLATVSAGGARFEIRISRRGKSMETRDTGDFAA